MVAIRPLLLSIYPAGADEPEQTFPQFKAGAKTPGTANKRGRWLKYFAGRKVNK